MLLVVTQSAYGVSSSDIMHHHFFEHLLYITVVGEIVLNQHRIKKVSIDVLLVAVH
jgi:hypothetical protein